jgi:hypothetical protein
LRSSTCHRLNQLQFKEQEGTPAPGPLAP